MTMSPQISSWSKPVGRDRIDQDILIYFRERHRGRVYDLVISEFERSGISQAELADRLGKGPDYICRLLGSPGNWTLDTESDLLFAISGGEVEYSMHYPLDQSPRNYCEPEWLSDANDATHLIDSAAPSMSAPMPSIASDTFVIDDLGIQNAA